MSHQNLPPHNNPYAAPTSKPGMATMGGKADQIRNEHLKHEASVKSIGTLYLIGGVMCALALVLSGVVLTAAFFSNEIEGEFSLFLIFAAIYAVGAAINFYVGFGLRKLDPVAKRIAVVFSVIGLLGIPIGTLISGYILWLLLSEKGVYVFSPEYKTVVENTPHIKYKTSAIVIVLLVIVIALVALAVGAAMFSTFTA